jgi:hypothetical protein
MCCWAMMEVRCVESIGWTSLFAGVRGTLIRSGCWPLAVR